MLMYTAAELIVTRPARKALFNVGMWLSRDRRLPVDQLIGVYKQHHVLLAVVQRHRAGSDLIACLSGRHHHPAWGGFLSVELVDGINAFFRRTQRFGYLQYRMTVTELMNMSDHDLFCKLCAPTHALNRLLPPSGNRASLRTRGHSYQLPEYSTDLHEKSFLIRSFHSFVE